MSEGTLPAVERQIRQAAEIVGNQAPILSQQAEQLGITQQRIGAVLVGANDPQAQELPAQWEDAARKTGEAADILAALQLKIADYAGTLAAPLAISAHAAPTPERSDAAHVTQSEVEKAEPKKPLSQHPTYVALRQDLKRKTFFYKRHETATPESPEDQAALENLVKINENLSSQIEQGSPVQNLLADFMRDTDNFDPFTLEEKAVEIADLILQDTDGGLDMADVITAHVGFKRIRIDAQERDTEVRDQQFDLQFEELSMAVDQEIVRRADGLKILSDRELDYQRTYDLLYKDNADPAFNDIVHAELRTLQEEVRGRMLLDTLIVGYDLTGDGKPINDYNRPMSKGEKEKMDEAAAATIEGVHLLKTYGVTPMIIEGKKLGLDWDVAIVPPVPPHESAPTPEGAVADFLFVESKPGQERALLHRETSPDDPKITEVTIDGGKAMGRFRLHDNGQISYGTVVHNVPSDHAEERFNNVNAGPAFTRLRTLFITMAYDAVVPEDVIREQTGGSVASQYGQPRRKPSSEPLTEMALRRQRVLEGASVSDQNRHPSGWEWPTQIIGGYVKRLPEGCKARPTAEQEAREYYKSKDIAFEGLPEGKTFVPEYKRGTGPARTTFRKARFRISSKTAQLLRKKK